MDEKTDKTPTKVRLVFLARLFNPHVGGVEKHLDQLAHVLAKKNYSITIITEQYDPLLPLKESTLYDVVRIPQDSLKTKKGVWLWMLRHLGLFLKADIIHAHDVFWWVLPIRFLLWWKKYFTTFHGYEGAEAPTQKAIRSRKISERLSRGTICVGGWMRKWYGTQPDFVTHGAADFQAAEQNKNKKAVFIGRLSTDTGIMEYINGVALLHGKISLDIYGMGELLPDVEKRIKKLPYITYIGVANDVEKILREHRFAFVSRYLGMIEAMQVGRYVFAHWNNGIKRDYLTDFPESSAASLFTYPEELAQELGYILKHELKEKTGIWSAQTWAKEQTWEKMALMYEALWKK